MCRRETPPCCLPAAALRGGIARNGDDGAAIVFALIKADALYKCAVQSPVETRRNLRARARAFNCLAKASFRVCTSGLDSARGLECRYRLVNIVEELTSKARRATPPSAGDERRARLHSTRANTGTRKQYRIEHGGNTLGWPSKRRARKYR